MSKKNILCAVDLTERADRAIATSMELAKLYGAKLTLLTVVEPLPISSSLYPDVDKLQLLLEKDASEKLYALASRHNLSKEQIMTVVGKPNVDVLRVAEQLKVDLIIICDSGHYGIRHQLTGSTTRVIVNAAICDVYIVR